MKDRLHLQLQRQEEHLLGHILQFAGPCYKLQVVDATTYRYMELVRVDHTMKRSPSPLALRCP
jgi:hypothetical protein